jgi:hypothetical protein
MRTGERGMMTSSIRVQCIGLVQEFGNINSILSARAAKKEAAGRSWPAGRSLPTTGLDNEGSLTSHNPIGLQGLLRDSFTLWRRSVLPVRYELDYKYCYK